LTDIPQENGVENGNTVELRFYEELNAFLAPELRKRSYRIACHGGGRSVKDLIESQGVPHTEIDLILANGKSVGFDYRVCPGDRVSVYPVFESLDISAVSRLGRPTLRQCRFVADVHLGKLVRRLRLLGFDCLYDQTWDDRILATISADQNRVLLTRDLGLLKRAVVTHGIFLRSDDAESQLQQVMDRLDLRDRIQPMSRCLRCNGALAPAPKETVRRNVPQRTFARVDDYLRCGNCGKVYWRGAHWAKLQQFVDRARTGT